MGLMSKERLTNILSPAFFIQEKKMNSYIKTLVILLLLILPVVLYCETKTDEAHKKLENAESYSEEDNSSEIWSTSNDDDDDSSLLDFINSIVFSIWFNVDLVSETPGFSVQRVRYNPKPYYKDRSIGHRNSLSNRYCMINLDTATGAGITEDSFNSITQLKLHFFGFATNFRYRFLSEEDADDNIHYYSILFERKSVTLSRFDAGISAGWNDLAIGNDHYDGFSIGYNFEVYPVKPVSLKFQADNMFYKNKNLFELLAEMRLHHNNYYIGAGYNYFDIDRTVFRTILLHLGVNF